jgi:hypothetical protein
LKHCVAVAAFIPAKRDRKNSALHDTEKDKWRNMSERFFGQIKNRRRVTTR